MARLSKGKARVGPSHGHDFDRISDSIYGYGRHRINGRKELFSNDYIYLAVSEHAEDVEVGINKNRHLIHDSFWCNDEKDESHAQNRFIDGFSMEAGDDLEDFLDKLELQGDQDE